MLIWTLTNPIPILINLKTFTNLDTLNNPNTRVTNSHPEGTASLIWGNSSEKWPLQLKLLPAMEHTNYNSLQCPAHRCGSPYLMFARKFIGSCTVVTRLSFSTSPPPPPPFFPWELGDMKINHVARARLCSPQPPLLSPQGFIQDFSGRRNHSIIPYSLLNYLANGLLMTFPSKLLSLNILGGHPRVPHHDK